MKSHDVFTVSSRGQAELHGAASTPSGDQLALVGLRSAFRVPGPQPELARCIVVIVQAAGARFALLVDHLVGRHQMVVKNLETNYRKVPGVSGATILGDGSVAPIVDVPAMQRIGREMALPLAA